MMTITESIGLCMGAGLLGWTVSISFYLLRRYANLIS